jgi:very-short-patch-repair endonuclease
MSESMSPSEFKRAAKGQRKAQLEQRFIEAWCRLFPSLPRPTMQHKFHKTRLWRFDFAWVDQRLAVEIQGGAFVGGGHNRGFQQAKDYEKQRAAVKLGWRLLPFNTKDMDDADECATFVAEILTNAKEVA